MLEPFIQQQTIPNASVSNNTIRNYVSRQYYDPVTVGRVSATLAINSQFNVKVRLFEVFGDSYPDDTRPEGRSLLAGGGGVDYLTDDGESGLIDYNVNKTLSAGARLCWSFENEDLSNDQPVYARAEIEGA